MWVLCMVGNEQRQTCRGRKRTLYSAFCCTLSYRRCRSFKALSKEMHGQVCLSLILIWQQSQECI